MLIVACVISHWNQRAVFSQRPVWADVAPSTPRVNVSVTRCVCIMEAAALTLTPCALKKVSAVIELYSFTKSITSFNGWRGMYSKSHELSFVLPPVARGDTFEETEDLPEAITINNTTTAKPTLNTIAPTSSSSSLPATTLQPTLSTDPNAAHCSGRPFDAFLQLKNGSIYAFRGTLRHPFFSLVWWISSFFCFTHASKLKQTFESGYDNTANSLLYCMLIF